MHIDCPETYSYRNSFTLNSHFICIFTPTDYLSAILNYPNINMAPLFHLSAALSVRRRSQWTRVGWIPQWLAACQSSAQVSLGPWYGASDPVWINKHINYYRNRLGMQKSFASIVVAVFLILLNLCYTNWPAYTFPGNPCPISNPSFPSI